MTKKEHQDAENFHEKPCEDNGGEVLGAMLFAASKDENSKEKTNSPKNKE